MSLGSIFRFICNFISEFVRFILFFASILFMIVSVFLLSESYANKQIYSLIEVPKSDIFWTIIGFAIYMIVLSLFGVYGTFFRNKTSIELFSLLASLNVLIALGVFIYTSPRLEDTKMEVVKRLKDAQANYDWTSNRGNSSDLAKNATSKWDELQENYECCGVHGPADWDGFRPNNKPAYAYPISCCENVEKAIEKDYACFKEMGLFKSGCAGKIENTNDKLEILIEALIVFNLLLGFMGCIVVVFRNKSPEYNMH